MYALYGLREILRKEAAVVEGLLESSWLADGCEWVRIVGFWGMGSLYEIDRSSLSALITKPWFKDGLTNEEFMLVGNLGTIAYRSQTDALAIMGMPFLATFEPADAPGCQSPRQVGPIAGTVQIMRQATRVSPRDSGRSCPTPPSATALTMKRPKSWPRCSARDCTTPTYWIRCWTRT